MATDRFRRVLAPTSPEPIGLEVARAEGVRVTTKCMLGELDGDGIESKLETSLLRSLKAMKLERVDLFFLHSNIIPDDYQMKDASEVQHLFCVSWSSYLDGFETRARMA